MGKRKNSLIEVQSAPAAAMYCHSPICSRACLAGTKELQAGEHSDNGAWGQSVNLGIIYLSVTSIKKLAQSD